MAEGGHRNRADHVLFDPERPRQGRRKNTDIEGMGKGVVVVVLQLANGVEEIFADGQAGHDRTDDLAGPDDTLGFLDSRSAKASWASARNPRYPATARVRTDWGSVRFSSLGNRR